MKPDLYHQDSGIPWIGFIPAHWRVCLLKHVIKRFVAGGTPSTGEDHFWAAPGDGTPWVAISDMSNRDYVSGTAKSLTAEGLKDRRLTALPTGTVLYSMYASVGYAAILAMPAVTNQAILGLELPAELDARYLRAFLNALRPHVLQEAASNTQDNLNAQIVQNIPLVLPPIAEQVTIASYLDVETARIDALIEQKKLLVETLLEMKKSVVSEAVTLGVDRTSDFVPSGLSWAKKIPVGWKTASLKRCVRLTGGHTPSTTNPAYWDGSVPWFSPKDMKLDELADSIDHVTELAVSESGLNVMEPQTTMIVVRGMILAHTFPVCVSQVRGTLNQDMKALVADETIDSTYLPWLLRGVAPLFLSLTDQSGHGTMALRTERFMNEALPIPPLDMQVKIVAHLQIERNRINELLKHVRAELDLLRELRSVTITDAVLGHIDVRKKNKNQSVEGAIA